MTQDPSLQGGCRELPAYAYEDTAKDFLVEISLQKCFVVDNAVQVDNGWFFGASNSFDTVPKPDAQFDLVYWNFWSGLTCLGSREEKETIRKLGLSGGPVWAEEERPDLPEAAGNSSGSSNHGDFWCSTSVEGDWGPEVPMSGGGTTRDYDKNSFTLPACYAADLYLNGEKTAQLTLHLKEGGAQ